jgi:hypothetical protein
MPRNGSGVYERPVGTEAVPNETITSAQFNTTVDDLVTDANTARPITAGGTGAATASTARDNLAVARKVSSVTDTTADRGLIVGSGGLLGDAPDIAVTNANDLLTGHNWAVSSTAGIANLPSNSPGILTIERRSSNRFWQRYRAMPTDGASSVEYTRAWNGSVWSPWTIVYSRQTVLGTVSESGGVPTGALIQQISGSNGVARRFACGLQICWHVVSDSSSIATGYMGGFRSGVRTWTYPADFANSNEIVCTGSPGALNDASGILFDTPGTLSVDWAWLAFASQTSATRGARLQAVGRWF